LIVILREYLQNLKIAIPKWKRNAYRGLRWL
jgi:hypothetical protein